MQSKPAPEPEAAASSGANSRLFNIAQFLPAMAREAPERQAIVCAHAPDELGRTELSFSQLDAESDRLAWGFSEAGIASGSRTLLMVKPGLEFISITFALFKLGAVPVLIDPGMGLKNLLKCVAQVRPQACIAIPIAHAIRVLMGGEAFASSALNITAGRRWFWGGLTVRGCRSMGREQTFPLAPTREETPAAILFTSGGTGIPKGVMYEHGMFGAQVAAIRAEYGIEAGERDLPAFPLFGLFAPALGTTCVIPEMNPSRPAECDPKTIVDALVNQKITYTFGSPAIWRRVGPYCIEKGITLPGVRRILMAGAPVRAEVIEPFSKILPNGDTYIPYGATEALPVASIRGSEVLNETWALTQKGKGYCIGRPLPHVTVRVVACAPAIAEDGQWNEQHVLPPFEIGEIVVKGAVVTKEYFKMPEQTRAAKIHEHKDGENPALWHRMGDMGYFDDAGRLWFCGRKAHRVFVSDKKALYSVCVEAVFENFLAPLMRSNNSLKEGAGVRAALVGIGAPGWGRQLGVIVIETLGQFSAHDIQTLAPELTAWRKNEPLAKDISGILVYRKAFPVDVRHNAKINREQLSRWAEQQTRLDWK